MEEIKNVKAEEKHTEVIDEVKESKGKKFISKVKAGIKKNGKKIACGAAIVAVVLVGCAIGAKRTCSDVVDDIDPEDDYDLPELIEDSSTEEETEE